MKLLKIGLVDISETFNNFYALDEFERLCLATIEAKKNQLILPKPGTIDQGEPWKKKKDIPVNVSCFMSGGNLPKQYAAELRVFLAKSFDLRSCYMSGNFYYPPGGFMGWHTNSNNPGWRCYVTYAAEKNKSWFDYIQDGEIKSSPDRKGFTARAFFVDKTNLFWHRVRSDTHRLSFGFYGRK
tara:strand:+ start:2738 stop:3286 length:549 start_codon:yes stop_codon:yes gene_type:complete